jgi:hypothetical protein
MPRIMEEELLAHLPILSSSSKTPPSVWSHALPPPPLSSVARVLVGTASSGLQAGRRELQTTDTQNSSLTKYLMEFTARYSMSGLVTAASFGACRLHRDSTEMENASRL